MGSACSGSTTRNRGAANYPQTSMICVPLGRIEEMDQGAPSSGILLDSSIFTGLTPAQERLSSHSSLTPAPRFCVVLPIALEFGKKLAGLCPDFRTIS